MSEYSFTSSDQWKKHQVIGRGGSSTVYKVELKSNGKLLAMKEVQIDGLTKDQILAIEAEIETMKSLSDPNIVNYLGTHRHQNHFYMFLEYADGGSLRQFYQKNGRLNESQVRLCTKDMLLGLLYLHSQGIAHRDIKGANVLLTAQGEMKLADFGASKRLDTASIVSGLKGEICFPTVPIFNSSLFSYLVESFRDPSLDGTRGHQRHTDINRMDES
jgi:serine/threonine protein kinase